MVASSADVPVTKETALEMLQRIRAAAEAALSGGSSRVFLVIRRDHPPCGSSLIMCQTEGPRGTVINGVRQGNFWRVTASFRAASVAAFCSRKIEAITGQSAGSN